MNLADRAGAIEPRTGPLPWPDHEYSRGYAVMVLPFSSGHLLGLRVFPQNSFGPYASVWHRPPDGEWSIYNDGASVDTTCPRYWGPVLDRVELAGVDAAWTGPNELRVEMDEPRLEWTMSMRATPLLRLANAAGASLPDWTWRPGPLLRLREWAAGRLLGMGSVRFSFTTPSGHPTVIAPEEVFVVGASEATLAGRPLGDPVRLAENPTIGGVPLPTLPTFVFGWARMEITDPEEHRRTRSRVRGSPPGDGT